MKLIIDIPEEIFTQPSVDYLLSAIRNSTPIPDNATNVLDAIKLEIKQEYDNQGDWSFNDGLIFALDIIDKYQKGGKE